MIDVEIRTLDTDDVEEITSLASDIWHAHYPGIISAVQIDFMLAQRYSSQAIRSTMQTSRWDGAFSTGKLIGFTHSFADAAPASWKLDKLYIKPDFQRRAIGLVLLDRVRLHAIEAGASSLRLRVNKRNTTALAAYAKYGFHITGEDVLEIGHGYVMDDYLMELELHS